ncbi:MAG: transcription elongation factor GreA [Candidatus Omnitrophica bacterium]|nr:transcription elongation factor GreA [Candidatus Omnitrophota bacterium]
MPEIYLTKEGHEKLVKEYEFLKTVRRKEIAKAIAEARAQGDISENAEYDAAKDAQAMNEKRIADLEEKLSSARLLDDNMPIDQVLIGATVKLLDLDTDKELSYTLVSEAEADFSQGKISITSPVGSALLSHKEHDIVEIKVPAGTLKLKVLKISRS